MNVCHCNRAARHPGIVARITAAAGSFAVVEYQRAVALRKIRAHGVEQRRVAGCGQRMGHGVAVKLARLCPQCCAHLLRTLDARLQGLVIRPAKRQLFTAAARTRGRTGDF